MNEYLKLALEKKLKDNNIDRMEKFQIKDINNENYWYNHSDVLIKSNHFSELIEFDIFKVIVSDLIKLPKYEMISFKKAFDILCEGEKIYTKNEEVYQEVNIISFNMDGLSICLQINNIPASILSMKKYEFYKKIN